ncbi:hypothetical protein WJX81_003388 [Elliptochloris bilobata]|uniref:RNA polymerase II C-terminal domain phosphatase-like n=1 Tax=Elliptochloris bilobata TaxID=381761 RepID=A0AAW1RMM2_9CHLO
MLEQELADSDSEDDAINALTPAPAEASDAWDARPGRKRLRTGAVAAESCPPHPGFMHGMCIRCGAVLEDDEATGLALRYIHSGLRLSTAEAERVRQRSMRRVMDSGKLLLVLDLDHTLLNSTRLTDVCDEAGTLLDALLEREARAGAPPSLHRLAHLNLWTKLRPGVRAFLEAVARHFELHIYTHGDADYARAMAALLDPGGRLFAERVISQADSQQQHVKDLGVVLGAEAAAVIVDDTAAVWPQHAANLLLVERYIFFPACAERFGSTQRALLDEGRDEDPARGMLAAALRVLLEVHAGVFAAREGDPARDARVALAAARRRVLAGVRLCFSAVIPRGAASPQAHALWRLAEELGAQVADAPDEATTHVVSARDRTDKVLWARQHARFAVSTLWLHSCGVLWCKPDEQDFPVAEQRPLQLAPVRSEAQDLAAAMAGAGGGRGWASKPL